MTPAEETRAAADSRAAQEAEQDRRAAYTQYEKQMEADGAHAKSYDEWRGDDEVSRFLRILAWLLVPMAVFAVFIGYLATRDNWIRDYGGRRCGVDDCDDSGIESPTEITLTTRNEEV